MVFLTFRPVKTETDRDRGQISGVHTEIEGLSDWIREKERAMERGGRLL